MGLLAEHNPENQNAKDYQQGWNGGGPEGEGWFAVSVGKGKQNESSNGKNQPFFRGIGTHHIFFVKQNSEQEKVHRKEDVIEDLLNF